MFDNKCLFCAEIIPEGRQICPICEKKMLALAEPEEPRGGMNHCAAIAIKKIAGGMPTVEVKTAVTARVTITNKIPLETFIEKYHANIETVKREMENHYKKHIHLLFRGKLTKFDKVEAETYEITVG